MASTEALDALAELVELLEKPTWSVEAICHPAQLALVADQSPTVACTAGRRSGKSFAAAVKGIDVCLAHDNVAAVYIAATRASAKRMVWKPLLDLNDRFQLGGVPNRTDLTLTFPNGSTFHVISVDSEPAADKVRGIPNLYWSCVDESQRYRPDLLAYLLKDVLRAGQLDALAAAQQWLLGTPHPLGKSGAFWDRWNSPKTSQHHFTVYQNTKLGTVEQIEAAVAEILAEEHETRDSAWFRTEIMAEWGAVDLAQRVYHFDDVANTYDELPDDLVQFLICGDIGIRAADAVAVLGWREDDPTIYMVEEVIKTGQTDVDLGDLLQRLGEKYDPIKIVLDAGGGGAKSVATVKQLHPDLPIEAATKPTVNVQIKILNGVLKPGRFKVRPDSAFSAEVRTVGWVNGVVNGAVDEQSVHSDIIPACRYGVIAASPLLPSEDARPPEVREAEARAEARREMLRKAERAAKRARGEALDEDDEWIVDHEPDVSWLDD